MNKEFRNLPQNFFKRGGLGDIPKEKLKKIAETSTVLFSRQKLFAPQDCGRLRGKCSNIDEFRNPPQNPFPGESLGRRPPETRRHTQKEVMKRWKNHARNLLGDATICSKER